MILWVLTILILLVCVGMAMLLIIAFSYNRSQNSAAAGTEEQINEPLRKKLGRGLSTLELESMPGVEVGSSVQETECAVCLDEIGDGEVTRVMPECGHVFHKTCVDSWLTTNAVCPLCRNQLMTLSPLPPEPRVVLDSV